MKHFRYYPEITCIIQPGSPGTGGLYLSNIEAAQDLSILQKYNIKAVLSVVKGGKLDLPVHHVPRYLYLPAEDTDNYDIYSSFEHSFAFIDESLRCTNVLVHCAAGISRSATIVIAYLMKKCRHPYINAYLFVKSLRMKIQPNPGFIKQLQKYERHLLDGREKHYHQHQQQQQQQQPSLARQREQQIFLKGNSYPYNNNNTTTALSSANSPRVHSRAYEKMNYKKFSVPAPVPISINTPDWDFYKPIKLGGKEANTLKYPEEETNPYKQNVPSKLYSSMHVNQRNSSSGSSNGSNGSSQPRTHLENNYISGPDNRHLFNSSVMQSPTNFNPYIQYKSSNDKPRDSLNSSATFERPVHTYKYISGRLTQLNGLNSHFESFKGKTDEKYQQMKKQLEDLKCSINQLKERFDQHRETKQEIYKKRMFNSGRP